MTMDDPQPNKPYMIRDIILTVALLASWLPAIGGYFKLSNDVQNIKEMYVSKDQLAIEVQKNLGDQGIKAIQIQHLTEALKDNNEQLVALQLELKQMRLEWSNYRSHR